MDDYASAIGTSAEADNSATALGYQAKAKGTYSTAFGTGAKALGRSSVAIGTYSNIAESAVNSIAIGTINEMKHENSVAIGYATTAQGKNSVALGYNAKIFGAPNGMALGTDAQSRTSNSVALGYGSWAERGSLSDDNQLDVYLIEKGGNNKINKDGEVAKTVANTMGAVSVGSSSSSGSAGIFTRQITDVAAGSEDSDAVNVAQLKALDDKFSNQELKFETNYASYPPSLSTTISKKLGETLNIVGGESIKNKIGSDDFSGENIATLNNGGEIGLMMKRKPKFDGISFVENSQDGNPIKIEKSDDTTLKFLSKNNNKTKLTNIAAGTADTDAVNVSQLIKSSEGNRTKYFSVKSSEIGNADNKGANAKNAMAIGPNAIVETNAASSVALGDGAKVEANAESAIAIGHKASAKKTNSIAIGSNTKAGESSVAIGLSARTGEGVIDRYSYNSLKAFKNELQRNIDEAVKKRDKAVEDYNKAITPGEKRKQERIKNEQEELINKYEKIKAPYEKIIGSYEARYEYNGALITKADFDKLGRNEQSKIRQTLRYISSNTFYENSVAIGHDAHTLANDAVAIGSGAKVIASGGVAIGQGSVSDARTNKDLKGYEPLAFNIKKDDIFDKLHKSAWIATDQPFAVGDDSSKEKITRQITGVAAGKKDTDAVNVAQLKQIGFYAEGDIGDIGGKIQNEDEDNNILKIKTDGNWKDSKTNIVYTGKNLETRFTAKHFDQNTKKDVNSKFEIAMTDTPRFKSITIADDNVTKNQEDKSPIELKKFGDKTIGFAGKGDSTIKLTNLTDGEVNATSTDAVTGKQLFKVQEKTNTLAITPLKFADNNNNIINRKLGDTLRISGGQKIDPNIKEDNFTIGNIGVFKKDDGNLTVALAKELTDLKSVTTGNTVINNSGVTIKDGAIEKVTLTKDGLTIKDGPSVKADGINAGNRKITNVADGDISANSTDAVTGKQLHNITNSLNSKVSDVVGENNIEVKPYPSDSTKKIVSLKQKIDLTNNGSIKFGDGKTSITKDNVTSKDLVATNGTNTVTISGDDGTITGLTNKTWDVDNITSGRAATEDQLQLAAKNLQNNIAANNTEVVAGENIEVTKAVYPTKRKTFTVSTAKKVSFDKVSVGGVVIDKADNSIKVGNTKLDKDGITIASPDHNTSKDVKLTDKGLNNGGKKIVNVAPGTEDSDAATVGQIKHAVASAGSVKESDKKDKWAKKRSEAKGKNSVSIAGGSTDGGRSNTVSVGAPGHERTISNVAPGVLNSDAATVGQLKAGLNNVYGKLGEYKKDSRAGTASAMAIGNLPQSTIPGKGMVSLGGGFYDGESAMAIGLSKMSDDGKWVVKGSASYDSQENAGAAVSVGFHF